ncbi:MAG TPA: hypothetical protein VH877_29820 [Polyangia bacterium]|jgi:hypothetical protein|nr:hypothetical protein [Polyangia bacterium]
MSAVMRTLVRVRRRLRLMATLRGLGEAALLAAGMLLGWTALHRLGVLAGGSASAREILGHRGALICAGLLLASGMLRRAFARLPLRLVAHRIDVSHGLADRLRTALELSATAPGSGLVSCALADAARAAAAVAPSRTAPLRWPPYLRWTGLLVSAAVLLALLPRSAPASPSRRVPEPPRLAVAAELLEPDREAVRELARRATAAGDAENAQVASELERLIARLERGELSRKEFFDRLAALEQRARDAEAELEALRQRLRKAGHELSQHRLTQKTGQALGQDRLAAAGQELSNLGRALEQRSLPLDDKTERELGRTLERAARETGAPPPSPTPPPSPPPGAQRSESPRAQQEKAPASPSPEQEGPRRLTRETAPQTSQPGERRADGAARPEQQLQHLQRNLGSAGSQLSQGRGGSGGGQGQAAQSLRQAGETLRQMQDQFDRAERNAAARSAMSDLKELARRQGTNQQAPEPQPGPQQAQAGGRSGQDPAGERPEKDQEADPTGSPQAQAGLGGTPSGQEGQTPRPQPGQAGQQGQAGQENHGAQGSGDRAARAGTSPSPGRAGTGQGENKAQSQAERLRDFFRRAQGQEKTGDEEPSPSPLSGLPAPPSAPGQKTPGPGGEQDAPGADSGQPGTPGPNTTPTGDNRPGDAHDPHLLGDPTRIAAHHVTQKLQGAQGSGPSRSATILGASERGFATTAYRRVYGDYNAITEEVMSKERVPPGYRYYIKRYFQLIKPRE